MAKAKRKTWAEAQLGDEHEAPSATARRGCTSVQMIVTGMRPDVARTLVHLGVDLTGIITRGTLQSGVAHAMSEIGE